MRVAIDTSSLLSFVRYYLPFDKDKRLYHFIQQKIETKEILIIEEVYLECSRNAQGMVVKALPYLEDKKHRLKTDELLPTKKLFNRIENDFAITVQKKKLSEAQFESVKEDFLASADLKLILLALREKGGVDGGPTIVTEETAASNDGKAFKKVPAICDLIDIEIPWCDLPKYLQEVGIDFRVK